MEVKRSQKQIIEMREEIGSLHARNSSLRIENSKLRGEIQSMQEEQAVRCPKDFP